MHKDASLHAALTVPPSPQGQSDSALLKSAHTSDHALAGSGFSDLRFAGIWVPLITPFQHGSVDLAALRLLVIDMLCSGVHGLVACGTTAEAASLSQAEQVSVLTTILQVTAQIAGPDYPVVMGISGSDTAGVVEKIRYFSAYPIAEFLVSAPAYVRPSQQGILLHLI